jgi:hypothetical protein
VRLEEDKTNLLNYNSSSQGSGKRWFGDYFYQSRSKTYTFDFPELLPTALRAYAGSLPAGAMLSQSVRFQVSGSTFSKSIAGVDTDNNDGPFAANAIVTGSFLPSGSPLQVVVNYPEVGSSSEGWLDYIELNVRRKLTIERQRTGVQRRQNHQQASHTGSVFPMSAVV